MKCPKCGFNSFEYYDSCKKCAVDLTGYKQTYAISSVVLPHDVKATLAAEFRSKESAADEMPAAPEVHDDIFSFDLPDDSPRAPTGPVEDPFDFSEPAPATPQADNVTLADDIFGDLLESTPHIEVPSIATPVATEVEPATPSPPGTGEFDFDSFSWDDSPDPPAASGDDDTADDFDSFFEDTKEHSSK